MLDTLLDEIDTALDDEALTPEYCEVATRIEGIADKALALLGDEKAVERLCTLLENAVSLFTPVGALLDRVSGWWVAKSTKGYLKRYDLLKEGGMDVETIRVVMVDQDRSLTILRHQFEAAMHKAMATRTEAKLSALEGQTSAMSSTLTGLTGILRGLRPNAKA